MSFMQPEVFKGRYYEVSANHGETWIVPRSVSGIAETQGELRDYVEGRIDDPDAPAVLKTGWLARLSAPGYLDATDWSAHATKREAYAYLNE